MENEACPGEGLAKPGRLLINVRTTPGQARSEKLRGKMGHSRKQYSVSFSYVYLLVSESNPARHYTGLTDDLKDRLRRHNAGEVAHTEKYRPWTVQVAVAFNDRKKASEFEAYLKSHSGRAFAKRHF